MSLSALNSSMVILAGMPSFLRHIQWKDVGSDVFFMFLGTIVSFYATIVFERYKRFQEILRSIALARIHYEGYPISPYDLVRAHPLAIEYWRFLESQQWSLDTEGHYAAAAQVGRLTSFAFRTGTCIEHMLDEQKKKRAIANYLAAFQSEYGRLKNDEFTQFEKRIRPNRWALLKPFPGSVLPTRRTQVMVNYFDRLM